MYLVYGFIFTPSFTSFCQTTYRKSLDDSEPLFAASKLPNRTGGASDNNLLKSVSVDKERTNNVAKIKVVVCPFNTILIPFYSERSKCKAKVFSIRLSSALACHSNSSRIERKKKRKEKKKLELLQFYY